VVGDMSTFLNTICKNNYLNMKLEQKFDFPLTAICAYNKENINKYLSLEETKSMQDHHNPVWE
jgi:hypothetical protein